MDTLQLLREKLDQLLASQNLLKEKVTSLEKDNAKLQSECLEKEEQLQSLKDQLLTKNISGEGVLNESSKTELKNYIGQVLNLIDQSLTKLD